MKFSLRYKDKTYTLEFTREQAESLSRQGFTVDQLDEAPLLAWPKLFHAAFKANHPSIKKDLTDEIFEKLSNKTAFMRELGKMYAETVNSLFDEPEEDEGNATWETA